MSWCFDETGPMAATIEEDCRKIAEEAVERAAKSIWKKVCRSIEADAKAGRECRGAVMQDNKAVVAWCEEIHLWDVENGTRPFIIRMLKKYGLIYLHAYAMAGEAFEIAYPIYECRDLSRNMMKELKFSYTPGPALAEIIGRTDALAAQEGIRLRYELAGHWYFWLTGAGEGGRDAVSDTEEETVFDDIFSEHLFTRANPSYDRQSDTYDKEKRLFPLPFIRIRYERANGEK